MDTCPDCSSVKRDLANVSHFQIIDIGEHVMNLKEFLSVRDNHPAFAMVRQNGNVGIPCFVAEDGQVSFTMEETCVKVEEDFSNYLSDKITENADVCSIDGTGC